MEEMAAPAPLTGYRILVVEDEYYIADDLRRAALRLGAEVVGPAPTRERALELIVGPQRIDLAVVDINLRGEIVFEVADALEAQGVPFVFATGYNHGAIPERFGHVPCWSKPLDPHDLLRSLAGPEA
ncbi:MAG TPA: response regulator [Thermohalobaculum sp.]|nr:response regulator [Thermohalobaculum sp.]